MKKLFAILLACMLFSACLPALAGGLISNSETSSYDINIEVPEIEQHSLSSGSEDYSFDISAETPEIEQHSLSDSAPTASYDMNIEVPEIKQYTLSSAAPVHTYEIEYDLPEIQQFTLSDNPEAFDYNIEYTPIEVPASYLQDNAPSMDYTFTMPDTGILSAGELIDTTAIPDSTGEITLGTISLNLPADWKSLTYKGSLVFIRPSDRSLIMMTAWNLDAELADYPDINLDAIDLSAPLLPVMKAFMDYKGMEGEVVEARLPGDYAIVRANTSINSIPLCMVSGIHNHDLFQIWIVPGPVAESHTAEEVDALTDEVLSAL